MQSLAGPRPVWTKINITIQINPQLKEPMPAQQLYHSFLVSPACKLPGIVKITDQQTNTISPITGFYIIGIYASDGMGGEFDYFKPHIFSQLRITKIQPDFLRQFRSPGLSSAINATRNGNAWPQGCSTPPPGPIYAKSPPQVKGPFGYILAH